ncbi:hypothetical protein TIFTF001_015560 [Ficus carica]|uniref:AB hydrolase-1 domain-containing protein n=1 Tax=Ficus carica TaxID=3494 RepID=A0AA88D927_FICCA|nr:hypothetical protein TIFTF001_015560 [Ficus carica]
MSLRMGALSNDLSHFRWSDKRADRFGLLVRRRRSLPLRASVGVAVEKSRDKRFSICTADELHFVAVPNSDWKLALWRYLPSNKVQRRNHPLLLLSGIATNAIGYDLSPECSFARYMSGSGFDTWILELRGSGLSTLGLDLHNVKQPINAVSENINSGQQSIVNLYANADSGVLQAGQNIIRGSRRLIPARLLGVQENFSITLEDLQQQFDLIFKYDWDFDHFLEEDVPAAMEYIRDQSKPNDGKLHAIGHSMGGILLYAMLSKCCFQGKDSGLASVTSLASSLDYSSSRSSLKLLLPLADPAQALNVPAIPVGAILAAVHPFVSRPPFVLSWLKGQVSAQEMMHPELYDKLLLNNF